MKLSLAALVSLLILTLVSAKPSFNGSNNTNIPAEVDHRKSGIVTPVQDASICGSGRVASLVSVVESANALKSGQLIPLSTQQIVDCFPLGCVFRERNNVLFHILEKGLMREEDYPRHGLPGWCHYNESAVAVNVRFFASQSFEGREEEMKGLVAKTPVAALISGSASAFISYKQGILDSDSCAKDRQDFMVTIVGYGTEDGKDYWIAKNSWGRSWGEEGYVRIERNKNVCGIASEVTEAYL